MVVVRHLPLLLERKAYGLNFYFPPAHGDARDDASMGDVIERRDGARGDGGVMEREKNRGPQLDSRG